MKPETEEWVTKAEGNWSVAQREMRAAGAVLDIVCFLAQQCAEQYLKAFLEEQGTAFRKTHDLSILLDSVPGLLPELAARRQDLAYLGNLGIAARYPGIQASQKDAEDSLRIAGDVRDVIRGKLNI